MDAKQTGANVTLSVRVPLALRGKLAKAARLSGTSMTKEMIRLLDTQLLSDNPPIHLQLERAKMESRLYQSQLVMLENLLLSMLDPMATQDQAERLDQLYESVQRRRAMRARALKKIEAKIRSRARPRVAMPSVKESSLLKLLDPGARSEDPQLRLSVRRWRNLQKAITGKPRGIKKQLSEALRWTAPQISQLLSSPGNRNHRNISDDVARKLERALSLEENALDKIELDLAAIQMTKAALDLAAVVSNIGRPER